MIHEKIHLNTIDSIIDRGTILDDPNQFGVYFAFHQHPDPNCPPSLEGAMRYFETVIGLKSYFDQYDGAVIYPACVRLFEYAYKRWVRSGCYSQTIYVVDPKSPL